MGSRSVQIIDERRTLAIVDPTSRALLTQAVGGADPLVERGIAFVFAHAQQAIPVGEREEARIITNANSPRLAVSVTVSNDCLFALYEGSTWSTDGTQGSPQNRNRLSGLSPTTEIWTKPTLATAGTAFGIWLATSQEKQMQEFVLAPNTAHHLLVSNISGGTVNVSYEVTWYEPELDG